MDQMKDVKMILPIRYQKFGVRYFQANLNTTFARHFRYTFGRNEMDENKRSFFWSNNEPVLWTNQRSFGIKWFMIMSRTYEHGYICQVPAEVEVLPVSFHHLLFRLICL